MKKLSTLFVGILFLLLSLHTKAQLQNGHDYFMGKWNVVIIGTPNGDAKMIISLEKKDTAVVGVVLDTTNTEISKISKIEMKDSVVTVYFNAQGYDVYLMLERKDDDHAAGRLLDMFDVRGERIKEMKKL